MADQRFSRHLLRGGVVFLGFTAALSCGSRTGLFGPEPPDDALDRVVDVDFPDARGGRDAPGDAPIDVIEEPVGCVPGTFTFALAIPQLMFVLDRSGSMNFVLTSNRSARPGETSRWEALEASLAQTITPFSGQIAMGARFYPAANADGFDPLLACIQDGQIGRAHV